MPPKQKSRIASQFYRAGVRENGHDPLLHHVPTTEAWQSARKLHTRCGIASGGKREFTHSLIFVCAALNNSENTIKNWLAERQYVPNKDFTLVAKLKRIYRVECYNTETPKIGLSL